MDPLAYDKLSHEERLLIGSLIDHPGFVVLEKLMQDASRQATEDVIRLNPEDENYDQKLKARQMRARVTNEVCAVLIKSVQMHSTAGQLESQTIKAQKQLEDINKDTDEEIENRKNRYGSMSIKSQVGK